MPLAFPPLEMALAAPQIKLKKMLSAATKRELHTMHRSLIPCGSPHQCGQ